MNEGTNKKYVIGKVSKAVHHQSMTYASLTSNGVPDSYFDGPKADLWVEWKYRDAMPRDGLVGGVDDKKRGCYSTKQFNWMKRRWERGGNVIGVVFLPNKTAVIQATPYDWECGSHVGNAVLRIDVAEWINRYCTGTP